MDSIAYVYGDQSDFPKEKAWFVILKRNWGSRRFVCKVFKYKTKPEVKKWIRCWSTFEHWKTIRVIVDDIMVEKGWEYHWRNPRFKMPWRVKKV